MIGSSADKWIGLLCDASGASALVAQGAPADAQLRATRWIGLDPTAGKVEHAAALGRFVAEHGLGGCDAYLLFAGAGTIVQRLRLPRMSASNQTRAVRTRLASYASGRKLVVGMRGDRGQASGAALELLAAGVDETLARGWYRACRRVGLRVRSATALADAFRAPTGADALVQLVLSERMTAIQLFAQGRLVACRDVLLGRRDFVAAYQRPILTDAGPVTLSADQADALSREVGIPMGREDEIRPGIRATQLWPLLNPVLQKLRNELELTLKHGQTERSPHTELSVLGLPPLTGLGEYLAAELELVGPTLPPERAMTFFLAALCGHAGADAPVDVLPPEERFVTRMTRPALAAGLCAFFIMLANASTPRQASASLSGLRPLADGLRAQLEAAQAQTADAQRTLHTLTTELRRRTRLQGALPPPPPVIGILKTVLATVPSEVELEALHLRADRSPAVLQLRANYSGEAPASVLAAEWMRRLAPTPFFVSAAVKDVSGSGRCARALVEIEVVLR